MEPGDAAWGIWSKVDESKVGSTVNFIRCCAEEPDEQSGSNNAVKKLLLLIFKSGVCWGDNKNIQQKTTMTLIQTLHLKCITLRVGKQGVRYAKIGALAPVFKKLATEPKPNYLRSQNIVNVMLI